MTINLLDTIGAGQNLVLVPGGDLSLLDQMTEMFFYLLPQCFVWLCIRIEKFDGALWLTHLLSALRAHQGRPVALYTTSSLPSLLYARLALLCRSELEQAVVWPLALSGFSISDSSQVSALPHL